MRQRNALFHDLIGTNGKNPTINSSLFSTMGRRSGKKAKRWEDQHDDDNKEESIDDFEREWMSKRRKVAVQNDDKSRQQMHSDGVGKNMLIKQSRGGNANGDNAECSPTPDAISCTDSPNENSNNINHNSHGNNKTANENDNAKETHKEKEKLQKLRLKKQLQKQRRKEKKAAAATALQTTLQARQESRQQLLQQTKEFVDKKLTIRQFDATTASASTDNSSKTNKHQGFAPHPHPQNQRNHDILYQDLRIGRGPPIRHRKNTTVSYTLRAKSHSVGKVLDAGKSFSFRFGKGEVIKGWDIGLEGMRVGGVRRLIVKAGMGYGKRDVGAGRGGDLFFEVELLRVAP